MFDLLSHSDRERLKNVRQSTLSGNAPPTATPGSHDMPGPHVPQAPQAVLPSPAPPTAKPDVRTFQASGGCDHVVGVISDIGVGCYRD